MEERERRKERKTVSGPTTNTQPPTASHRIVNTLDTHHTHIFYTYTLGHAQNRRHIIARTSSRLYSTSSRTAPRKNHTLTRSGLKILALLLSCLIIILFFFCFTSSRHLSCTNLFQPTGENGAAAMGYPSWDTFYFMFFYTGLAFSFLDGG